MIKLKITTIGTSCCLLLSKEALAKLGVGQGDTVHLSEMPDGFRLTRYGPEFERQMMLARGMMKKHQQALQELANKPAKR